MLLNFVHCLVTVVVIIYLCLHGDARASKVICSPTTQIVNLDDFEYVQFQSPDYPSKFVQKCEVTFYSTKRDVITIVASDMIHSKFTIYDALTQQTYNLRINSQSFSNNITCLAVPNIKSWKAFFVYIYADKKDWLPVSCPGNGRVYNVSDLNTVVPLISEFPNVQLLPRNCTWIFHFLKGHGVKFFFNLVLLKLNDFLTAKNATGHHYFAYNNANVLKNLQYAFDDYIELRYEYGDTVEIGGGFIGSISIVTDRPVVQNGYCQWQRTGNSLTWSNTHDGKGYGVDEECRDSLNVSRISHQLFFLLERDDIENIVDYITVSAATQTVLISDVKNTLSFNPSVHNDQNIDLLFRSDGGFVGGGFEIKFIETACECNPTKLLVNCSALSSDPFMAHLDVDSWYCDNLDCTFEIVPMSNCASHFIVVNSFSVLRQSDSLTLTSENRTTAITNFYMSSRLYFNSTHIQASLKTATQDASISEYSWKFVLIANGLKSDVIELYMPPARPYFLLQIGRDLAKNTFCVFHSAIAFESKKLHFYYFNNVAETVKIRFNSHFNGLFPLLESMAERDELAHITLSTPDVIFCNEGVSSDVSVMLIDLDFYE